MPYKSVAVILGSAFGDSISRKLNMKKREVETDWGGQIIYEHTRDDQKKAYVLFRHGHPHRLLPNQINYRAQAAALNELNCGALLINSSVGLLDADLPLFKPMLITDLLMPENRLPDGATCTMFPEPSENHGHLVLNEGLFSHDLHQQILELGDHSIRMDRELVFVYAGGPRSKTPAENRMWSQLGGQVNSMTVGPEVVLANELEIPAAALVVGHKYSVPGIENPPEKDIRHSLKQAREATEKILVNFLEQGNPVPFKNHIYRY